MVLGCAPLYVQLLTGFHPERGQISTLDFVAVAEEIGLIGDIGRWVMQRSAGTCANGATTVCHARLSPSLFELELTEDILMQDAEAGRRSLLTRKEFGFALGHNLGLGIVAEGVSSQMQLEFRRARTLRRRAGIPDEPGRAGERFRGDHAPVGDRRR